MIGEDVGVLYTLCRNTAAERGKSNPESNSDCLLSNNYNALHDQMFTPRPRFLLAVKP